MSFLVDTNVFCEPLRRSPDREVVRWLADHERNLYVSTLTLGEIRRGIERLPEGPRRSDYQRWLGSLSGTMRGSILSFNRSVAHCWGQMQGQLDQDGITLPAFDGMLAATAIRHELTVVTRNERDFQHAPVRVINPFCHEQE